MPNKIPTGMHPFSMTQMQSQSFIGSTDSNRRHPKTPKTICPQTAHRKSKGWPTSQALLFPDVSCNKKKDIRSRPMPNTCANHGNRLSLTNLMQFASQTCPSHLWQSEKGSTERRFLPPALQAHPVTRCSTG